MESTGKGNIPQKMDSDKTSSLFAKKDLANNNISSNTNSNNLSSMFRTNSIQAYLQGGAQSPQGMSNFQNFSRLSLVSPMYESAKPKQEIQFSNPLDLKKSPSIIKMESQSDFGQRETPLPLPMDTPAIPIKKDISPSIFSGSLTQGAGPTSTTIGSLPKQPMPTNIMSGLRGNVNQFNQLVMDSGMDANELAKFQAPDSNYRRPQEEPTLQNIVSTVDLKCRLDLKTIALNARNTEYNPKRFAAAIMKIRNPKTTALIFSSGKMVCTGAKSEEDSKKAAKKYAKTIKNMGFDVRFTDFKVQNIVASADVGFAIRLESLSHRHAEFCQYEPEIFPGLIYRIYQPKVVVLIFVSGKIVLTGAKTREQIKEAYTNILPALQMHKKEETTVSTRAMS